MKIYEGLSKKNKIGLTVSLVMSVLLLLNSALSVGILLGQGRVDTATDAGFSAVMSLVVFWYALVGFKKPHGNELRTMLLLFAFYQANHASLDLYARGNQLSGNLLLLAALAMAFVAGRLDKIEKNKILLLFVGILSVAERVLDLMADPVFNFQKYFSYASPIFILAALSFAYTARYEQHKEAGEEVNS